MASWTNPDPSAIEPRDIIAFQQVAYMVREVLDPADVPAARRMLEEWPAWRRQRARVLDVSRVSDGLGRRLLVEMPRPHPDLYDVRLLAKADDEEHWPVCQWCGEPWPCHEVETIRRVRREVNRELHHLQQATDLPHECPAGCSKRFRTKRGATMHAQRARRHNPDLYTDRET